MKCVVRFRLVITLRIFLVNDVMNFLTVFIPYVQIALTCFLALAATSNAEEQLEVIGINIDVAADQDAAEWKRSHYYNHHYIPHFSYFPYAYKYWRSRRSEEEYTPEHIEADQEVSEWYRHGYYGHSNPYGYRNYHGRFETMVVIVGRHTYDGTADLLERLYHQCIFC